jgi:hypothetical protein
MEVNMKKIVCLLVCLFIVSIAGTCLAFPAEGRYESDKRNILYETGEDAGPLEILKINESGYSGTFEAYWKGYWKGTWSVPTAINKNSSGRYEVNLVGNPNGYMEIEEIGDGSLIVYVRIGAQSQPYKVGAFHKVN